MPKPPVTSWLPARSSCLLCREVPHGPASVHEFPSSEPTIQPDCSALQNPNALLEGFCPEAGHDDHIALNANGLMLFLRLADIDWLEAAEEGVTLHVDRHRHLLRETLEVVAAKLPPGRFLRIAPSTLVNLRQVKELQPMRHGRCAALLHNGTRLIFMRR